MDWTLLLARFAAGSFIANSLPHLVNGISGKWFPTPFAKPPAVGKSSPLINVVWAAINLAVGYWLLVGVGNFQGGLSMQMLFVGLGALFISLSLAWHFGRLFDNR